MDGTWNFHNNISVEQENGQNEDLINSMSDNVSPHDWGNHVLSLSVGFSVEQIWSGFLSGEGERGEGIHDQVNPEHLNGVQGRFSQDSTSQENHEHGDDVDGDLELEELSD